MVVCVILAYVSRSNFQEGPGIPQWELKIEGVLLEEVLYILYRTLHIHVYVCVSVCMHMYTQLFCCLFV